MSYWIVTDACCDLPRDYILAQDKLKVVPMLFQADDEEQLLDLTAPDCAAQISAFYAKMRAGAKTRTAQINQQRWEEALEPLLKAGEDVLALVFSSGLSSTAPMAALAVASLQARYPERKIFAVDSLCASVGEGLFVHEALQRRNQGMPIAALRDWAEQNRQRVAHWFTVEDLVYLKRGGRISAASYFAATVLNIKPVLNVDPKGHLVGREKTQGRKRSLKALIAKVEQFADRPEEQTMFIGHGDCLADAQWVADQLKEKLHVKEIILSSIGSVIGAHSGPGTLAVFFLDKAGEARMKAE